MEKTGQLEMEEMHWMVFINWSQKEADSILVAYLDRRRISRLKSEVKAIEPRKIEFDREIKYAGLSIAENGVHKVKAIKLIFSKQVTFQALRAG